MTRRERIAAYREAARQIAEEGQPWYVINEIIPPCRTLNCPACKWIKTFGDISAWWGEHKDVAILAYCLAAEMVRTGDL